MKDYYKEKCVSNSSLSWFLRSPKYFHMMLEGKIDEYTPDYFKKGQQIHMYILEPEEFNKEYDFLEYEIPKSKQQKEFCESFARAKKGKKDEKLLNAYKKAYSTKESDEKILEKADKLAKDYQSYIKYIKQSQAKQILPMSFMHKLNEIRSSVLSHKKARELLYNEEHLAFGNTDKMFIQNELPIYWEYPESKLSCKSMLDRIIIDHDKKRITMVDLKTTSHMSEFANKAIEYRYNRQMAFYWMAIHWYFKNELNIDPSEYEKETYIVAVSTTEPTEVKVFKMTDLRLNEGLNEIEQLMYELSWHFENEKWDYPRSYYEGEGIERI
jgi:hypothetical protein